MRLILGSTCSRVLKCPTTTPNYRQLQSSCLGLCTAAAHLPAQLRSLADPIVLACAWGMLSCVVAEVVLALLRNPKYCIYGAASQKTCSSTTSLETAFNSASVKERSKFEQETLVNVGGSSARRSTYRPSSSSGKPDELIVVTMLVATGCKANIPDKINSLSDLKQALEALGGLPQDQVLGVELLWTPQVRAQAGVAWVPCVLSATTAWTQPTPGA